MNSDTAVKFTFRENLVRPYERPRGEIFIGSIAMVFTISMVYSVLIPLERTISTLMGLAWVWAITAHVLLIGFFSIRHRLKYTNADALIIVYQFPLLLVIGCALVMSVWSLR